MSEAARPRRLAPHTRILLGLLVGAFAGLAVNAFGGPPGAEAGADASGTLPVALRVAELTGRGFLLLLLVPVVPLVFASLALGIAGLGGLRAALPRDVGAFDVVVCVGNTLPHVADEDGLVAALADARAMLQPDGALVLQILNYDRILAERNRFLGASGRDTPDGAEHVFFRFYDFPADEGARLTFNMVTIERDAPGAAWRFRADSTELLPIRSTSLGAALAAAGFDRVRLLGSYAGEPFDPKASGDLVAIARTRTERR
jgi:SAM-dependent methyltransferase